MPSYQEVMLLLQFLVMQVREFLVFTFIQYMPDYMCLYPAKGPVLILRAFTLDTEVTRKLRMYNALRRDDDGLFLLEFCRAINAKMLAIEYASSAIWRRGAWSNQIVVDAEEGTMHQSISKHAEYEYGTLAW